MAAGFETALRAVGKATVRKPYAFEMAMRADRARKQLAAAAKAAPNVPEIAKMLEFGHSAGLKLNNERSLTAAADGVLPETGLRFVDAQRHGLAHRRVAIGRKAGRIEMLGGCEFRDHIDAAAEGHHRQFNPLRRQTIGLDLALT